MVLRWVGTTSHAWGAWVPAGATVEDWVEQAIALCAGDEICEVNVFEGPDLVTHEIPVPEANRPGLKWVFLYRQDETPSVVVEEAHAEPGREPRTWTFDPSNRRQGATGEALTFRSVTVPNRASSSRISTDARSKVPPRHLVAPGVGSSTAAALTSREGCAMVPASRGCRVGEEVRQQSCAERFPVGTR